MAKIRVKFYLENKSDNEKISHEFLGILSENKLIFYDGQTCITISIDSNKIKMKRSNLEYDLNMIFSDKKELGTYLLKEYNTNLDIEIITKKLNILHNGFIVEYESKFDCWMEYYFKIEYEVI